MDGTEEGKRRDARAGRGGGREGMSRDGALPGTIKEEGMGKDRFSRCINMDGVITRHLKMR